MEIKESDDYSIDYKFLSKYIRDDAPQDKQDSKADLPKKFTIEKQTSVEVFGSVGEGESFSNNPTFSKSRKKEPESYQDESYEKIESKSDISDAKKEFIEHLKDDSLSVDTCSSLTHDWNNN